MNTFDKMKDDLKTHGHHKGNFYANDDNPYESPACLMGSMYRVLDMMPARYHYLPLASQTLEAVISEQFPDRFTPSQEHPGLEKGTVSAGGVVVQFNDHKDTTLDEVILVLEKAAMKEAERV